MGVRAACVKARRHTARGETTRNGRLPRAVPTAGARAASLRLSPRARDLELDPGAGKPELEQAIEGHVLTAAELVGTYER
jgi:hypothetical protein